MQVQRHTTQINKYKFGNRHNDRVGVGHWCMRAGPKHTQHKQNIIIIKLAMAAMIEWDTWDTLACNAQAQTHTKQTNIKSAMAAMIERDISHHSTTATARAPAQIHTKKHKQNIT